MERTPYPVLATAFVLFLAGSTAGLSRAQGQPEALVPGVLVVQVLSLNFTPIRLVHDPATGRLLVLRDSGSLYGLEAPYGSAAPFVVAREAQHGTPSPVMGLAVASDGTLYLSGNRIADRQNTGVIRRGRPDGNGGYDWTTVAEIGPFPRSGTFYDHNVNGLVVSPDGAFLFVNSGSRTDHGEEEDYGGHFPGVREVPATSAIFRIPADAEGLVLPNDLDALLGGGYLFADGVRNSFDLAFDGEGRLFATENGDDRDDAEEINWIREGHHYGFPWRIGTNDNPQQFAGYDPAQDPLLNPAANAVATGLFYNDPAFPRPPDGVTFTDPFLNEGPDADYYRDSTDGRVKDASETGVTFGTLTPHRSPLGLVFDVAGELPAPAYVSDGFVLSWTGLDSPLLQPFGDEAEDLLHLEMNVALPAPRLHATRLVRGFDNPIDAALVEGRIYVVEYGGRRGLWEVVFQGADAVEETPAQVFTVNAHPNPASGPVRVEVAMEQEGRLRAEVYDLLGRRVAELGNARVPPGRHTLNWEAGSVAPGIYLIRVAGPSARRVLPITIVH